MDNSQQVLPVFASNDDAYFDSFFVTQDHALLISSLRAMVEQQTADFVYLSGHSGLGKSHLIQAVCNLAAAKKHSSMYLPLRQLCHYHPEEVLAQHQNSCFLCLDDIDAIAGHREWEVALFDVYNQRIAASLPLFISGHVPAALLDISLADLKSRLSAMLSFQLTDLSDAEKAALLHFRAAQRGMDLNELCLGYILQRSSRDIAALMHVLQTLDKTSLAQGRKITVPFIKNVMRW